MKILSILLVLIMPSIVFGQDIDTLSFYSKAFKEERTVYIHKPKFYKYKSASVKLPVIYLLDGQNNWFINPLLSNIQYLQYIKEIPHAIVVVIPHKNRNKECDIVDLKTKLPLDTFITSELDKELSRYNLNNFKVIIGHSFSASFSLYSYYHHPDYYSAVIANTPFDNMQFLVKNFQENNNIENKKISISIGGIAYGKDDNHRKLYNQLKEKYPNFFNSINVFEANYSTHNAVPIVSTPTLLTKVFKGFRNRYSDIAKVDNNYKLINVPKTEEEEIQKILNASLIQNDFYPPEIPDINGIASRYWNNGFYNLTIEVYKLGLKYYPKYYEFYISLYDLTQDVNKEKSRAYLERAEVLLKTVENNWQGKSKMINDIKTEKIKQGWN
ncbi:MAG: hypothetical protein JXK08_01645 [Flavobacteriaceae bacterium]|nr:hypothetical protein [Flavobacteriaceae bacterium]